MDNPQASINKIHALTKSLGFPGKTGYLFGKLVAMFPFGQARSGSGIACICVGYPMRAFLVIHHTLSLAC